MVSEIPRIVIGAQQLLMYDWLPRKPLHGAVAWTDGVWAEIQTHLPDCRDRHCLLLLSINPVTKRQLYQHGDPGPSLEIDPERAGFAQLKEWLSKVHSEEDARLAASGAAGRQGVAQAHASGAESVKAGLFTRVLRRRQ